MHFTLYSNTRVAMFRAGGGIIMCIVGRDVGDAPPTFFRPGNGFPTATNLVVVFGLLVVVRFSKY